jgi:release factor glutamine methyltransferase
MNSKMLFQAIMTKIFLSETEDEKAAISYALLEHYLGISRNDVFTERPIFQHQSLPETIEQALQRINAHEPLQYVIGQAWFYGRVFDVNRHVLIPRPETELLIDLVKEHHATVKRPLENIVDFCTGSGCLAITLKMEFPSAEILGTDISKEALAVAESNAQRHQVSVQFHQQDVLTSDTVGKYDVLVSNPPYVTEIEKKDMTDSVLRYEPSLALFVPDDDPLLFYRAIASRARRCLKDGGLLAVEINHRYAREVTALFESGGFSGVSVHQDLDSKARMVSAVQTG